MTSVGEPAWGDRLLAEGAQIAIERRESNTTLGGRTRRGANGRRHLDMAEQTLSLAVVLKVG
jgi:hypothetical protein